MKKTIVVSDGLAACCNALRQNAKADVSIQSEPGKGVRVTIRFSRAAAAADVDAKPSENN